MQTGDPGKQDHHTGRNYWHRCGHGRSQVARAAECDGRRAGQQDHAQSRPDHAGKPSPAERRLDERHGALGGRMARGQFGVGQAGERGEYSRHGKGERRAHSCSASNFADQHIDAGANDGAKTVQDQGGEPDRARQRACGRRLAHRGTGSFR